MPRTPAPDDRPGRRPSRRWWATGITAVVALVAVVLVLAAIAEVSAPGFTGKGRQGLTEFWAIWNGAFPDNQVIVRVLFAEGDRVAEESVFEGTNDGPLPNPDGNQIPATGRRVSESFSGIHTVRDGRIVSTHFYFDRVDLLTQLGLMPA